MLLEATLPQSNRQRKRYKESNQNFYRKEEKRDRIMIARHRASLNMSDEDDHNNNRGGSNNNNDNNNIKATKIKGKEVLSMESEAKTDRNLKN